MGKVRDESQLAKAVKSESGKSAPPRSSSSSGGGGSGGSSSSGLGSGTGFWATLTRMDRYKPVQGNLMRNGTAAVLGLLTCWGALSLHNQLDTSTTTWRVGLPLAFLAILGWFIFRLVNYPRFAEFLIATEAEMNKVSWIAWEDLKKTTYVLIVVVILLSAYLFAVDYLVSFLLTFLSILK